MALLALLHMTEMQTMQMKILIFVSSEALFVKEATIEKIPCVNINAKSAIKLVNQNAANAKIVLNQDEWIGDSHNVILDLPGETDEMIVLSAHYDSTPLSQGVYDNMSGSVGLLGIADYFRQHPHHYSLRFLWCGSEERGLLGSKAYVAAHEEDLKKTVFKYQSGYDRLYHG